MITAAAACSLSLRCLASGSRSIKPADLSQQSEYFCRSDENSAVPLGTALFHSVAASIANPAATRMLVRCSEVWQLGIAGVLQDCANCRLASIEISNHAITPAYRSGRDPTRMAAPSTLASTPGT